MGKITLQQAAQWCGGQIDPKYKDVAFFRRYQRYKKITARAAIYCFARRP